MNPTPRRGAQPNNLNALKNGFYSRSFRALENADLQTTSHTLKDEIRMLRILNRRLFDLATAEDPDLKETATLHKAIGINTSRVATLLLADQKLGQTDQTLADTLHQALNETISFLSQPSQSKGKP